MHTQGLRPICRVLPAVGLGAVLVVAAVPPAAAYTPESPEVKAAVARAVGFLESDAAGDGRVGARALVGLTLLKADRPKNHPKILEAVETIRKAINKDQDPTKLAFNEQYSPGLAIIFLCELDPSRYSEEIQKLLAYMEHAQRPWGGWGYASQHSDTSDTSMTQYGVLSMWEATEAGFLVKPETVERVTVWLCRTQDPSGGFGYQGRVSPTFAPVKQDEVRLSMSAAAMGSLYICGDLLGLTKRLEKRDDGLPPALSEVKEPQPGEPAKKPETRVDARVVLEVKGRGNGWIRAKYTINPGGWNHYYMYALERYMSFRALAEGEAAVGNKWYDDGVKYLLETQQDNGSWSGRARETADTAFGALFLMRSTQKTIEKTRAFAAGTMIGGRDLPKITDAVRVRGGKVVATPKLGTVEQVLAAMEDADENAFAGAMEAMADLPAEEVRSLAARHAAKLKALAGDDSPAARLAAVQALTKTRNMDHVPILIYALEDQDPEVMLAARDGLRRISRKLEGFGMPDNPSDVRRLEAIDKWKAWYRAVRPDAEFAE